jgi:hypothetical protein
MFYASISLLHNYHEEKVEESKFNKDAFERLIASLRIQLNSKQTRLTTRWEPLKMNVEMKNSKFSF